MGDPVKENLAYIRQSLQLAGKESMVHLMNSPVSDRVETLYPVTESQVNQGGIALYTLQELQEFDVKAAGAGVESVTLRHLLDMVASRTIIVKIDVEGMECKVLQAETFNTG